MIVETCERSDPSGIGYKVKSGEPRTDPGEHQKLS